MKGKGEGGSGALEWEKGQRGAGRRGPCTSASEKNKSSDRRIEEEERKSNRNRKRRRKSECGSFLELSILSMKARVM